MLLSDLEITALASEGMITPFTPELVRSVDQGRKVLSYGLSSYGYDLRLSPKEFWTFRPLKDSVVDPKAFNPAHLAPASLFHDPDHGTYYILPANSYGLGVTLEHLSLPEDVTAIFIGKSTYARAGVIANLTPGEAGWQGHLTLEFSNSSNCPCRIYANEGIVQALFFRGTPCNTTYKDRAGKYQNQPHTVVHACV
jgi:dCTP deaminase